MTSKITIIDYFRMPFFKENWLTFICLLLPIIYLKRTTFKDKKIPWWLYILIAVLALAITLPTQSYMAIKFWKLSDQAVLYGLYPFSALAISAIVSFVLMNFKTKKNQATGGK